MRHLVLALLLAGCGVGEFADDEGRPELDSDKETDDDASETELAITQSSKLAVPLALGGHKTWAHFTDPTAVSTKSDMNILDETVRLIRKTPAGETVRAAIHSFTARPIEKALLDAVDRGVIVKIVEDGDDELIEDDSARTVAAKLGANHVFCGDGNPGGNYGCITRDPSGIMHTKLMTFSKTEDPDGVLRSNVSWFGSANMTYATGAKSFNNTITIYGDQELYGRFNSYFGQLFEQKHFAGNDYYDADSPSRGFYVTPSARVYASPDQDGDLVYNRLNDIVPGNDCEVRVGMSMMFDSRERLVDLLVRLKNKNCLVRVVGNNIKPAMRKKLRAANIPTHWNKVHDKYILVNARFAGSAQPRMLVFTGSHNWTSSANSRNDELFVRLDGADVYDAFADHFRRAFQGGTTNFPD